MIAFLEVCGKCKHFIQQRMFGSIQVFCGKQQNEECPYELEILMMKQEFKEIAKRAGQRDLP